MSDQLKLKHRYRDKRTLSSPFKLFPEKGLSRILQSHKPSMHGLSVEEDSRSLCSTPRWTDLSEESVVIPTSYIEVRVFSWLDKFESLPYG
ncbi:unnamed protein product [Aspergillus oryzae var. brunneus]|uniref:Unnamed protein product n=2 Tax=Aspergillus oryzae TaxID=5062 RepID=A0AAN5BU37_ASPOZ|nr:unnamed protein product [Aspergillus oryzae]GMG26531.1 unnamed protein product [Aspergillus oryzae]GMG47140.1 unnamed protein product [Aspergillus oryzae var. brunneus]